MLALHPQASESMGGCTLGSGILEMQRLVAVVQTSWSREETHGQID